jgi:hypothetical protein
MPTWLAVRSTTRPKQLLAEPQRRMEEALPPSLWAKSYEWRKMLATRSPSLHMLFFLHSLSAHLPHLSSPCLA